MYIPSPSGSYAVGSKTYSFTDTSRTEQLGPNAGKENRKLSVRMYYPVNPASVSNCTKAHLISREVMQAMAKEYFLKMDYDKKCQAGENDAPYYEDAPSIPGKTYPLILFSHGYKSYQEGNSFLCAELASHGYVVLSIGHSYEAMVTTYTDGTSVSFDSSIMKRQIKPFLPGLLAMSKLQKRKGNPQDLYDSFVAVQNRYNRFLVDRQAEWLEDSLFILEQAKKEFSNIIDFSMGIGATGHSIGGSTAYALCHASDEITCGVNIDGGLFGDYEGKTMTKPFFQICSENNESVETKPMLNKTQPAYYATFKQIKHIAFADVKFFFQIPAVTGKIPAKVMHENLCKCHLDFFDKYLKKKDLAISIPESTYIHFEQY